MESLQAEAIRLAEKAQRSANPPSKRANAAVGQIYATLALAEAIRERDQDR